MGFRAGGSGHGLLSSGAVFQDGLSRFNISPSSPPSCDLPLLTPYMSFGVETLCGPDTTKFREQLRIQITARIAQVYVQYVLQKGDTQDDP